jgi:hypothetical protein
MMYELLDHYLDAPKRDWVADFATFRAAKVARAQAALAGIKQEKKASKPSLPLPSYAGRFADPWYGPMEIRQQGGQLRIDFKQTPNMAGNLEHWQYDTFVARWDDKSIEPAYVSFALDPEGGIERITMKPFSPLADFSYDYQDLLFTPAARGE